MCASSVHPKNTTELNVRAMGFSAVCSDFLSLLEQLLWTPNHYYEIFHVFSTSSIWRISCRTFCNTIYYPPCVFLHGFLGQLPSGIVFHTLGIWMVLRFHWPLHKCFVHLSFSWNNKTSFFPFISCSVFLVASRSTNWSTRLSKKSTRVQGFHDFSI